MLGFIDEDEFDVQGVNRRDADQFYYKANGIFSEIFHDSTSSSSGNCPKVSPSLQSNQDSLCPLKVPKFDSNSRKLPTFFKYSLLSHNNSNYSEIRKFQYLLTLLVGEPPNRLITVRLTAATYSIA